MQSVIKAQSGQSMYDLCLMATGSLNGLVSFCDNNGVTDINALPTTGQEFTYDPLQTDPLKQGITLSTAVQ